VQSNKARQNVDSTHSAGTLKDSNVGNVGNVGDVGENLNFLFFTCYMFYKIFFKRMVDIMEYQESFVTIPKAKDFKELLLKFSNIIKNNSVSYITTESVNEIVVSRKLKNCNAVPLGL
jgi:hypothetical protein